MGWTILVVLLILIMLAGLPVWSYSRDWGNYPSGIVGVVLIVLILIYLIDHV